MASRKDLEVNGTLRRESRPQRWERLDEGIRIPRTKSFRGRNQGLEDKGALRKRIMTLRSERHLVRELGLRGKGTLRRELGPRRQM